MKSPDNGNFTPESAAYRQLYSSQVTRGSERFRELVGAILVGSLISAAGGTALAVASGGTLAFNSEDIAFVGKMAAIFAAGGAFSGAIINYGYGVDEAERF